MSVFYAYFQILKYESLICSFISIYIYFVPGIRHLNRFYVRMYGRSTYLNYKHLHDVKVHVICNDVLSFFFVSMRFCIND